MTGAIIVTHGNLATAIFDSAQMIVGPQPAILAISVDKGTSPEIIQEQLESSISTLKESCTEILLLTDLFGGTPTNICSLFLETGTVELISGINLPILLKFIALRQTLNIDKLVITLLEYGKNGIIAPSKL